jgi:hypothetical protein
MDIVAATAEYERWLGSKLPLVAEDLELKHRRMAKSPFRFLRATYYRWAQSFPDDVPPELANAPRLVAVGDLHTENFGTWIDREGRLAWGMNDLDEIDALAYTNDLLRLATSAILAIREDRLPIKERAACRAILSGYRQCIDDGGHPIVIAEKHEWLRGLYAQTAKDATAWWAKISALEPIGEPVPEAALELLATSSPGADWRPRLHRRVAGLGSLGRRRVFACGEWRGGLTARELKQTAWPTGLWLDHPPSPGRLRGPTRPDDRTRKQQGWTARRLAPDCVKLRLGDYTKGHSIRLLTAMGFETGNIHLCSAVRAVQSVREHLHDLDPDLFEAAAAELARKTRSDWKAWRAHIQESA